MVGLLQMSEIKAADHKEIIHKRKGRFNRIQSDLYKRVKSSWRLPRGIDSRHRKKCRGTPAHPNPGYGSDRETRFMLPDGFKPVLVRTMKDLEALTSLNKTHCAVMAKQTSARLRREMEEKAQEIGVKIQNAGTRVLKKED